MNGQTEMTLTGRATEQADAPATIIDRVADILREHRGRQNAISRSALCERTGTSDRELRQIVAFLVVEQHFPIMSSPGTNGYWWEDDPDVIEKAAGTLKDYIGDLSKRETALRKIADDLRPKLPGMGQEANP